MSELQDKIDLIHENVSIYDLLDISPRPIKYETREIECQIACPFHGRDLHKSARVYPETNSIYCWACSKGWDVIAYWAEANEMWLDNGKRNIGKAVNDLCYKFNLRTKKPDWRLKLTRNLERAKQRKAGFAGASAEERKRLKVFYATRLAKSLRDIPAERRRDMWPKVAYAWDTLDGLNLELSTWKEDLSDWDEMAKITLLDAQSEAC